MAAAGSLLVSHDVGIYSNYGYSSRYKGMVEKGQLHLIGFRLSSYASRQNPWSLHLVNSAHEPVSPVTTRCNVFLCRSILNPSGGNEMPLLKAAALVLVRSYNAFCGNPRALQVVPAVGVIAFAVWGLGPIMRFCRILFFHKSDSNWRHSGTRKVLTSYLQPLLLWTGATLLCRALDPVILPSEASQAVKQRLLNFVRSLSTVLAFSYCLSSLIQQTRNLFMKTSDYDDTGNMGFEFAGKAVYTAVWVAAVSLFMELLGFSTQKWLTAGGLSTVLLTLAGREIFTNFLSSVMIHATRPFVVNEWIQTKIEGYEVSGTVEHVGWWSPTIIRGDDREAVYIPNHKFTVNVVRNLSQKTHWRIKTHLAISHLDVKKLNNIVADMRKVLAKNPQVEQQRLHRRVFLDYVDTENQALMVMVSCFVKTSHFEEYLCVKEAILLDLLRVISHHRARLATPIRTVQKIYNEADLENAPLADTIFTGGRTDINRPLLLIDPSYKMSGDNKGKTSTRAVHIDEEHDAKVVTSDLYADAKVKSTTNLDDKKMDGKVTSGSNSDVNSKAKVLDLSGSGTKSVNNNFDRQQLKKEDQLVEATADSKNISSGALSLNKLPLVITDSGSDKTDTSATSLAKQDGDKSGSSPSVARPTLEDNIVLGVALEGSKRVLPIEEEMMPSPTLVESKESATCKNGNGVTLVCSDSQIAAALAVPSDQRDKER